MKELIIAYIPTVFTFILSVFTIVKTIKGLNLVDANKPVKALKSQIETRFGELNIKLEEQIEQNKILEEKLAISEERSTIALEKLADLEANIGDKFSEQKDLLTDIVVKNVELKAEARRLQKDDSEGIQG